MAKKDKQRQQSKPKAKDPAPSSPPLSRAESVPVSTQGVPGLHFPDTPSPHGAAVTFASSLHDDAWQTHDDYDDHGEELEGDEEDDWADTRRADDVWDQPLANAQHDEGGLLQSPAASDWNGSASGDRDVEGISANRLASALTSLISPGVSRKSTLKKSPAAQTETAQLAASSPVSKHVAFGFQPSQTSTLDLPPTVVPSVISSASAAAARHVHSRSQSQGQAAQSKAPTGNLPVWGQAQESRAPALAIPSTQPSVRMLPTPTTRKGAGAWTQWRQEALTNEEARKKGITRVAAAIEANIPAAPAHAFAPMPPPVPAADFGGRKPDLSATHLFSQSHSAFSPHTALRGSTHAQAGAVHRRQGSVPAFPVQPSNQVTLEHAWQDRKQPAQGPTPVHIQYGQAQVQHTPTQPAGSWGAAGWTNAAPSPWDSAAADFTNAVRRDPQAWSEQGDEEEGEEARGDWDQGGRDPWGGQSSGKHDQNSGKYKHHHSSGDHGGEWQTAGPTDWTQSQPEEEDWGMRRKQVPRSTGHGAFGSVIHEEDEEEEEEDYDDLEDMYTDPEEHDGRGKRKPASLSGISYQYQSHLERQSPASHPKYDPPRANFAPSNQPGHQRGRSASGGAVLPDSHASRTMNFATGRMNSVFEPPHPQQSPEETFVWSHGAGLQYAQRAFYGKSRPARERIHWAFDPHKDPRVGSLMHWIEAMAERLAMIGLQTFLETGQRGALVTNADYRVNPRPGTPVQPAFDWLTLDQVQATYDRILQESVLTYKPGSQVVVFVFLLSKSENSMAMWRRKLSIPEHVRAANKAVIDQAVARLPIDKVVYVDETPLPDPPPPPVKKKKRGFWRRLFRLK